MMGKQLIGVGLLVLWASAVIAQSLHNDDTPEYEDFISEPDEAIRYDGAQLWRINLFNEKAKRMFKKLLPTLEDASLWSAADSRADVLLKKKAIEKGAGSVLRASNISYKVVIPNIQERIDRENPKPEIIAQLQNRDGRRMTWYAYHRAADIYGFLQYMAATFPDICKLITIGYSYEMRPLQVLRISNGKPGNKAIWIDGGIHAREWISPAAVTYILNYLVEEWDDQPDYIKNVNWYIQPLVNPDGYEYTHTKDRLWRKNRNIYTEKCVGVDLNRNYGYFFGGEGTSSDPCDDIFRGSGPFSESETMAHKRFFDQTKEHFKAYLSFHSYGQYILYPWGHSNAVPDDVEDLERVAREASWRIKNYENQDYRTGPSGSLLYPAAGGSDDYAKSIGIKYAYTIELRDTGRDGFSLSSESIKPAASEALIFVDTLALAVAELGNE